MSFYGNFNQELMRESAELGTIREKKMLVYSSVLICQPTPKLFHRKDVRK